VAGVGISENVFLRGLLDMNVIFLS